MFRKNVQTWLSRGGYYTPTPDTLFVSPERHKLLNSFGQSPYESGTIMEIVSGHDSKLGRWLGRQNANPLTERLEEGRGDDILLPGLIPPLPYAGFGYFIKRGGLLDHAVQVFDLIRTQRVAQLSFLITPLTLEPDSPRRRFTHSRYNHMLDVAAMLILITEQLRKELTALAPSLGFASGDAGFNALRNTLVTAGAIHDALTVAGGDGVKFVDPKAFDEDMLIVLLMGLGKYKDIFFNTWSVNREALRSTIYVDKDEAGKKRYYLLNHILDLADKLAYTSRDVWQYVQRFGRSDEIGKIVTADLEVCSLWKAVKIIDGKLVCTNYRRLGRFLQLRVLMFRHLYNGMGPRGGEIILGHCLCGYMYRRGMLSICNLLGHDDQWLGAEIARFIAVDDAIDQVSEAVVIAGEHDSLTGAHSLLFRERGPEFLGFVEKFRNQTNPATDRFFTQVSGRVGTFRDMHPDEAGLVEEIHDKGDGKYRGYGLDLAKLGVRPELRKPLCQFALHESEKA